MEALHVLQTASDIVYTECFSHQNNLLTLSLYTVFTHLGVFTVESALQGSCDCLLTMKIT